MADMLPYALAYAEHGWPVLPLHSPINGGCDCGKGAECPHPAKHPRTLHGLTDASADPEQIRKWWGMWPTANIGVAIPKDIVVADFDTDGPNAVVPELTGDTAIDQTGKGWHFWYSIIGREVRPAVRVLPNLDIRAFGSYVVAPPSVHVNGRVYTWVVYPHEAFAPAPDWLVALLGERERSLPVEPPKRVRNAESARRHIERLAKAVAGTPEGVRNNVLFWAACRAIEEGIHPEVIDKALRAAARDAGLSDGEIDTTLLSSRRKVAV